MIIESGVALTQEIHDGPFETYTGHGLWAGWQGHFTYSLEGKRLIRIDLDPAVVFFGGGEWELCKRLGGWVEPSNLIGGRKCVWYDASGSDLRREASLFDCAKEGLEIGHDG